MKTLFVALLTLSLYGCSTPFVRTVEIIKPVPVPCPIPAEVEKPVLPIYQLTNEDKGNYNKIGKSYVESVILLEKYSESLEQALEVYKDENL